MKFREMIAGFALMALTGLCGAAAAEIVRISDDLYVAGQPTADELAAFGAEGGRHVIDLRSAAEDRGYDEPAVAARAGLTYHAIPIAGAAGLTRENVERLDGLLARLDGEPTLLHCASANRVGALMALRARWIQGESAEGALEIGRRHGLTSLQPQVERLLAED